MTRSPYLALDVHFMDDPLIVQAGEKAAWLYLAMALDSRAHRTDGVVAAHRLQRLGVPGWKPRLTKLLDAGLVIKLPDGGYALPGYLKWNPSENDYRTKHAAGVIAACQRHHPNPCPRPACQRAAAWLETHGSPIGSPIGSPTG